MHAVITGVGHFVPKRKLTNKDLEQMVHTNDEWIVSRTGIKERRILEKDKGTSYMATKAAQMVLNQKNISASKLDLIIVATSTPDMVVPNTAALVQKKIGATNCWGFDLNGACAGFVCALATASQFIETGKHKKVMVIGADKMSSITNYEDRNTCILFGDAAGAVLLEPSKEDKAGIEDFIIHLDGSGDKFLSMTAGGSLRPASHETVEKKMHYVYQDGKMVFKCAINRMANVTKDILKKNNITENNLKLFIPHQANYRIIEAIAKKLKLNEDQVAVNIDKYGNTTAATIPLAMSESYQNGKMKQNDWIIIAAFGGGFTWGSLLLRWAMD